MLPVTIAAQAEDEGQRIGADEEVGMIGGCAQQVERNSKVGIDKAAEHFTRGLDGSSGRGRVCFPQTRLDEGGRRTIQLRLAGQEEAEASLLQPGLGVFEGEDGVGVLAPTNRPRCV